MRIQYFSIQNFGAIHSYEAELTPELNLLDSRYTDEIAVVAGFLLCNKTANAMLEKWLREDTRISARVCLSDAVYTVCATPVLGQLQLFVTDPTGADAAAEYQYALSHCLEQDEVESFDGQDKTMPLRISRYCDQENAGELSLRTRHFSETKTFRKYLLQYIRKFQPEPINCQKEYRAAMDLQGKFRVLHPEFPGKACLSETERKLFRYICFLNVAEFWADFEKIRDLHHEKKPLLVQNLIEFLDESADISGLITRTQMLRRQIIILTSPLDEKTKKKWTGESSGILF